ncbi:MAG: hypothetical protein HFI03_01305 [Lachnospiraceae bacterium]|jgi:hypothetical protein|nr:hypothetical protein [Lachnospiraceae bacterium]
MPKTDNSPTPETQIRMESLFMEKSLSIDKMRLTVTNIYPAFQKKSEQETRQEIEARLYRIFNKYA